MADAGFPQPPEVVRQQQAPPQESVFNAPPQQAGGGGGDVQQQIMQGVQELDQWATKMKTLLDGYDKSLAVFLQPIAQAGMELGKALQEKSQRSGQAGGSPVVASPGGPGATAGQPGPRGV